MVNARSVISPCDWSVRTAADVITLDYDTRHRRRLALVADGGTAFLLDLPRAAVLLEGDGLLLDDGRLVRVAAADEPLMHVVAGPGTSLARLAWHIGNRHLPAVIHDDHLLLRKDHVIAAMLEGLGATVTRVMAAFTPEQGAYSGGGHSHGHGHSHRHEHEHRHGEDDHHHGHHHHDHAH